MVSTEVSHVHQDKNIRFLSLSNVHVIIQGTKTRFRGEWVVKKEVGGTVDRF